MSESRTPTQPPKRKTVTAKRKTAKPKVARSKTTQRKKVTKRATRAQSAATPCNDSAIAGRSVARAVDAETNASLPSESAKVDSLAAYRMRMRLIGDLLNASIGELVDSDVGSDRVGRSAYLHIMGQVFEALDGLSQALPLDDLVRLSKIVAEQRRAELNTRKVEAWVRSASASKRATVDGRPNSHVAEGYQLPAHFNAMVRQLYGVTLEDQDTGESNS